MPSAPPPGVRRAADAVAGRLRRDAGPHHRLLPGRQAGDRRTRARRDFRRRGRRYSDEDLPAGAGGAGRQRPALEPDRQAADLHDGRTRQEAGSPAGSARPGPGRRRLLPSARRLHLLAARRPPRRRRPRTQTALHRALRSSRLRRRQPRGALAARRPRRPLRQADRRASARAVRLQSGDANVGTGLPPRRRVVGLRLDAG